MESLRNSLIIKHLPLAKKLAYRRWRRLPTQFDREEIEADAIFGLVDAADRFDASLSTPFEAFASKRIQGAMIDSLRKQDVLSRRERVNVSKVDKALCALTHELGRVPTDAELSARAEVPEKNLNRHRVSSIAHVQQHVSEPVSQSQSPEGTLFEKQRQVGVMDALAKLPARTQLIVRKYFIEEHSMSSIASMVGVTETRISQIIRKALSTLVPMLSYMTDLDEGLTKTLRLRSR